MQSDQELPDVVEYPELPEKYFSSNNINDE